MKIVGHPKKVAVRVVHLKVSEVVTVVELLNFATRNNAIELNSGSVVPTDQNSNLWYQFGASQPMMYTVDYLRRQSLEALKKCRVNLTLSYKKGLYLPDATQLAA